MEYHRSQKENEPVSLDGIYGYSNNNSILQYGGTLSNACRDWRYV